MSVASPVETVETGLRFNSERSTINGVPVFCVAEDANLIGHDGKRTMCTVCQEITSSKRALFRHLEQVHHYVDEAAKPVKVVLLVGWLSAEHEDIEYFLKDVHSMAAGAGAGAGAGGQASSDMMPAAAATATATATATASSDAMAADAGLVDSALSSAPSPSPSPSLSADELSGNGTTKALVETALFEAIRTTFDQSATTTAAPAPAPAPASSGDYADAGAGAGAGAASQPSSTTAGVRNFWGAQSHSLRPKSLSRGSQGDYSTLAVGIERTCHALADTFCFQMLRPPAPADEEAWLDRLNAALPANVRVLSCQTLPGKGSDMNAQGLCTQRRFEYMIPLDAILPEGDDDYSIMADQFIEGKVFKTHDQKAEWKSTPKSCAALDTHFPADTPMGERRVRFFRILKQVMKTFGGRYQMFYNFCSGGVCPDDVYSMRTVDRMYHKDMLLDDTGRSWALFSISGDNFLRGQIRRLFGLAFAVARGWLPEQYVDLVLRFSTVHRDRMTKKAREQARVEAEAKAREREAGQAAQAGQKRAERAARGAAAAAAAASATAGAGGQEQGEGGEGEGEGEGEGGRDRERDRERDRDEDRDGDGDGDNRKKRAKPNKAGAKKVSQATGEEVFVQDWRNSKSHICELSLSCEALFEIPSVPSLGLYLAECKYANYEAKYDKSGFVLDARRCKEDRRTAQDVRCVRRLGDWELAVQRHIMHNTHMRDACSDWAARTRAQCAGLWAHAQRMLPLLTRTEPDLRSSRLCLYPSLPAPPVGGHGSSSSLARAPEVYRRVLRLLQEADYSGLWPASSVARQRVMNETGAAAAGGGTAPATADSTYEMTLFPPSPPPGYAEGGVGGTFSVGAFPRGLQEPKGNGLFPELMWAAFELERLLLPNRPPSSTIAINRNAQFKLHRDSGIGSGQSLSAIVALGDYVGGEIGVEYDVFDIRYKPLEFDGWSQRHYTLPFQGERYSLVWFTPQGCEQESLRVAAATAAAAAAAAGGNSSPVNSGSADMGQGEMGGASTSTGAADHKKPRL